MFIFGQYFRGLVEERTLKLWLVSHGRVRGYKTRQGAVYCEYCQFITMKGDYTIFGKIISKSVSLSFKALQTQYSLFKNCNTPICFIFLVASC